MLAVDVFDPPFAPIELGPESINQPFAPIAMGPESTNQSVNSTKQV